MKKILLSIIAIFSMEGNVHAQTLSIDDVEVLPGGTASFALTVDVETGVYSGFQTDMQFPATGFATTGNATPAASWTNGTIFVGDLTAGFGHVSALSTTDQQIPAGEMVIGNVEFTVDAGVALGDYDVTISNFNFLDGTNYTPVSDVTFTIHVVNMLTVELDEDSPIAPEAATNVKAKVKRTIYANEWSTLVLPFAMSEAQVKGAFGNDVQLADFTGVLSESDAEENIVGLTVNFVAAEAIEANHPYLIKVSAEVKGFTVDGVDIEPEDEPSVDRDKLKVKSVTMYNRFIGTYMANTILDENTLFLSGNKFWYSAGATVMKAFRGYFDFYDVLTEFEAGAKARFTIEDKATAIKELKSVKFEGSKSGWYSLDGCQLVGKPTEKGTYINNGKKVVIK